MMTQTTTHDRDEPPRIPPEIADAYDIVDRDEVANLLADEAVRYLLADAVTAIPAALGRPAKLGLSCIMGRRCGPCLLVEIDAELSGEEVNDALDRLDEGWFKATQRDSPVPLSMFVL